ncbi:tripartite motif-containing protein 2-like [Dysidea avara]|uniref:tripartite motif-containing protein 2-like n=1 Tax=Dysidea avara TaxID=196820 RepID=UPI0033214AB0
MAAKEVKKPTTNLTCPVCYQLFKNPKYLPCYHSYCEECLEKMVVQSKITCPECRQEAVVPAGGVKELASNFFINCMVDELVLQRKVEGEEEVKCDECDEDEPVVSYCPECNVFLCNFCNDNHKRNKRFRGHGIVTFTELRSNKDVHLQAKAVVLMCKKHDTELFFYCETCEQLVCLYCTVKDHNGHNYDTVKKMAGKHRQEIEEISAPVEKMITSLSKARDNIDKMRVKIRQQGEEVNKKIDQHYSELVQKLMEQKVQLKQEVDDTVSQKEKVMTTQLEEVEYVQAEMLSMKELKDAVEKSSDQEALSAKKQVIDRMQQLTDKYQKLSTLPVQSTVLQYVPGKDLLPHVGQLFTHVDPAASEVVNIPNEVIVGSPLSVGSPKVEFTIITKYSIGHPCSTGDSQVSVQVQSSTGEVTATQVRDNNDGSYTASFVAQQTGEMKVSIFVNGQHIKESPYNIVVVYKYAAMNKPSKIVNYSGSMGEPWGIAFGQNGTWAVADHSNNCVYIYDDHNRLIKQSGFLDYPTGIAFDNDNSLFVSEWLGHRVKKLDINGNCLLQFGSQGSAEGQLHFPCGITVHNNRVYVAEDSNQCISVFQTNGQFCQRIGEGNLSVPRDVIVHDNQLFIADKGHCCVYIFTIDGTYISKFDAQANGQDLLSEPWSIDADPACFLLVAEYANHCISVFDKAGKFLCCFGSEGSADGQFKQPNYVAVSPDGKVYVSDGGNKRIQIFSVV